MCPCFSLIPPNPPLEKGEKKDKFRKRGREGRIFSFRKVYLIKNIKLFPFF
ncbi:MAG: hypothetical protein JETT_0531 [Candidatus Jettenia ecosi]|uniref:Uncharacterized protein n=1 Tax=Candidatus Jettenia ecosi TaxID=2494326 RepID=A0A533QEA4_9BACT|nr:MAG: hypothetical protein JETT_0531 [Candidatus Jettenia ecosi]